MKVLVTGGAGFIGSALIRYLIQETSVEIVNLDKLTYAATPAALFSVENNPRYFFEHVDIIDARAVKLVLERHQPDIVMHLAAESHVDRSIDAPADFIQTNIVGTYVLLSAALAYWQTLTGDKKTSFRFHHISTDEVFGSLGEEGLFLESTPYSPNSPYSASKASSDHLVNAWHHTFGLPTVMSNCSNNYGEYQFPEKLIPLVTINAVEEKTLPVYGKGENVRDWLYVGDHVRALWIVATRGRIGEAYNVGGHCERKNIDVVETICDILDEVHPRKSGTSHRDLIEFVSDRPGHDLRYAIDCSKLEKEFGWSPTETFESGLKRTIEWYLGQSKWWNSLRENKYDGVRLGKPTTSTVS